MAKRKRFGLTWWGQRFLETLDACGWQERLQRGRTYARSGAVLDLQVKAGQVTARVRGSRPKPYRVTVRFQTLTPSKWSQIMTVLASQPGCVRDLLSGEMPAEVEDVFASAGATLFPDLSEGLDDSCSCPDWASPCKHVAAVFYRLSEELDTSPLLLLELRGRPREALVRELQERRGSLSGGAESSEPPAHPLVDSASFWSARTEIGLPPTGRDAGPPTTLLDRLGRIASLPDSDKVHARLQAYYRVVAIRAQELLNSGTSAEEGEGDVPPGTRR